MTCEILALGGISSFITADLCQPSAETNPVVGLAPRRDLKGSHLSSHPWYICHLYLWTGLVSLLGEGAAQLFNVKPLVAAGWEVGPFFSISGKLLQTTESV